MNTVFPIGYSTPGTQERIDELLEDTKTLLIDTRLKPYSWNDLWRKEALEQRYGNKYRWAGQYLGNAALGTGRIEIADPDTGIRGLTRYLNEQHDLILLCQCREYSKCHVHTICNLLKEAMPQVTIVYNGTTALQQYSNTVSLFDSDTASQQRSDTVTPSHIQERRYSVSDVIFEDVGDMPVPAEYQELYAEYCEELEWLTRPGTTITALFWCATECHYVNRFMEKEKHKAYSKSLLCSGDSKKIEAAVEAMKRLLLKWDSSRGIAKMNQQAYAAREQQKLREKSDPKIRAWEQYTSRNPYYPDKESLEAMKEREEEKLMKRVEEYQRKWRSNGYPVPEPRVNDDGYMVVEMPEGWMR